MNTAVDADDGNPILRERVAKALRSWSTRLQAIVREAAIAGEARIEADPKNVATMVIASLEGAMIMSRIERSNDTFGGYKST